MGMKFEISILQRSFSNTYGMISRTTRFNTFKTSM